MNNGCATRGRCHAAHVNRVESCSGERIMAIHRFFGVALIALMCCAPASYAAPAQSDVLVDMFKWWNQAFKTPGAFTEAAFRKYYTEDTVLIVNGAERVRGVANLTRHFQKMQREADMVEIVLPFEESFASGDKVFTYHLIKAREAKGGVDQLWHTMGWVQVREGRIALINFINYLQPPADATAR
jgi:ketosteroid isomerase-like protein